MAADHPANPQDGLKQQTVLVVDDYADNLSLACFILESLGFEAVAETSAERALAFTMNFQPGLILLDMLMPDMDGFEFMQVLKSNPRTQNIPVVAVTALAGAEDRENILQAGCLDCIQKPFEIETLEALVHRYLF